MKNLIKQQKNPGFTLVEIMVALTIFSTTFMISLAIFANSQKVQQRTLSVQQGQSDARYALELISRYIRLGEIDYEYYVQNGISLADPNNPPSILALRDSAGLPARFQLANNLIQLCTIFSQTGILPNQSESCQASSWVNLTPANIRVDNLDFYISPAADPYLFDSTGLEYEGGDYQEMVTIVLETTINPTKDNYSTHFQTTITPRVYRR